MATRRVWILNLDAEYELAASHKYQPNHSMQLLCAKFAQHARTLIQPEDSILDYPCGAALSSNRYSGHIGMSWCPTPRALHMLHSVGATVQKAPQASVLRKVNHRRFCAEILGQFLPDAIFAENIESAIHALQFDRHLAWILKRGLGFSGRNRICIQGPSISESSIKWIEATFRHGESLQIEPCVHRVADFGLHGFIEPNGSVYIGKPTQSTCSTQGQWEGSTLADEADFLPTERNLLQKTAHRIASALITETYFGPFGFDAFRWKDSQGNIHFNPCCDINARYSMGWAIGMQHQRVDLSS